jgi:hypothetical protein
MSEATTVETLLGRFRRLAPWRSAAEFTGEAARAYIDTARLVQSTAPEDVESALAQFLNETDGSTGSENETRLFLLLRFVFGLPASAPADQRRTFKGWVNWPLPDAQGHVNLSWPVDWQSGSPVLLASFEGADGPRYGAIEEYRHLLTHFPFRGLSGQ